MTIQITKYQMDIISLINDSNSIISAELTCGCCAGMQIQQFNFDQKSQIQIHFG